MKIIPFSPPDITQDEIDEVIDTLKSNWITTGSKTKLFEKCIAQYCHTSKAVALNSATACMELTLRLLGIGKGDEVITSAYTYTASASVIAHVGAQIVMVDVGRESFHIDYDAIEDAITENTKAIIPIDIAGVMCDYDKIFEIVERKKKIYKPSNDIQKSLGRIIVLADAAHSLGAVYKGKMCGEVADFTSFSFHAVKNVTTAEGGGIVWKNGIEMSNDWLYKQYVLYSLHGQSKDAFAKAQLGAWEYDIMLTGYKCNMTDIAAAIGIAQISRYEKMLKRRHEIINMYDEGLKELDVSILKHVGKNFMSSGHLYLTRINGKDECDRNKLINRLAEAGIAVNVHYKPLPMFTAYKKLGFNMKNFTNAYEQYKNEITLPLNSVMTNEDVDYVLGTLKRILC